MRSQIPHFKTYVTQEVDLTDDELTVVLDAFTERTLKRHDMLLQENEICTFVGYIASGNIRHFVHADGEELTCYVSIRNEWISDIESFTNGTQSKKNFQAMKDSTVFLIDKEDLNRLYNRVPKFKIFGKEVFEQVVIKVLQFTTLLAMPKPEERYQSLVKDYPELCQEVPQKYLATMIGIQPESLSRIRRRIIQSERR